MSGSFVTNLRPLRLFASAKKGSISKPANLILYKQNFVKADISLARLYSGIARRNGQPGNYGENSVFGTKAEDDRTIQPEHKNVGLSKRLGNVEVQGPNTMSPKTTAANQANHTAVKKSRLLEQMSSLMDRLLTKMAVAVQKVNTLTGTDYSNIEALRKKIREQEQLVAIQHSAVYRAREAVDNAHNLQGASQKEVVGLLERKSSWSASDLERYMALIRSEHSNEQAVQAAKENLAEAERALEEARSQLEKRERAQYHQEQIWSDTIRRNSTWVTIGLMGVNILILLSSVVIIEPWRRKNMVKEIGFVLDRQHSLPATDTEKALLDSMSDGPNTETQSSIDEVNDRRGELMSSDLKHIQSSNTLASTYDSDAERSNSDSIPDVFNYGPILTQYMVTKNLLKADSSILRYITSFETVLGNAISERNVTVRQIDLTKVALQGVTIGACIATLTISLMRSA